MSPDNLYLRLTSTMGHLFLARSASCLYVVGSGTALGNCSFGPGCVWFVFCSGNGAAGGGGRASGSTLAKMFRNDSLITRGRVETCIGSVYQYSHMFQTDNIPYHRLDILCIDYFLI
jgi:hypothetical protein